MREMKAKAGYIGARLYLNECGWTAIESLFADDTVLLADSERKLQKAVDEFYRLCVKKLRVNVGKSKVMVIEPLASTVVAHAMPFLWS